MKKTPAILVGAAALGLVLTGCGDATVSPPASMCGYTIGNGKRDGGGSNDRNIQNIVFPGQKFDYNTDDSDARYFPCATRNYVISGAQLAGDSHAPLKARTSTGTEVDVWVSAYWQPNQSPEPIRNFITFLEKYGGAASDPGVFAAGENSSTPGWNKMLAENMYPTLQRVAETAVPKVGDEVWLTDKPDAKGVVAQAMSDSFAAEMQKTNGFTTDLFCGSGSTGSGDSFDCQQVRIVVDRITAAAAGQQQAADQAAADDRQRKLDEAQKTADINLTNEKYGPLAPAFRACRDLKERCTMVVGPNEVKVAPSVG